MSIQNSRLRVLLVPDSVHWVLGTIAKSIVRFNPWIEGTVVSSSVLNEILANEPDLMGNFDLVHLACPYASRQWLPRLQESMPCVTSHHHVIDWELFKHNLAGDAIVVGSQEWEEDLRERGAAMERVFYVPYGVDAERFVPADALEREERRNKLGISTKATVVGFFAKKSSNDDDRKGTDVFTQAVFGLHQQIPDLTVLIVGPGWSDLVESFRKAGIQCVWFPFIRDGGELARMYHALDFYWVTARVEGGPVTLLEAMSSEVCCITTPVGLAREIVVDQVNAALVPIDDVQQVIDRTVQLARDVAARQQMGRHARQTILEQMHVGVTTQRITEVYACAFENFTRRTQVATSIDVRALSSSVGSAESANTSSDVTPLNGIPVAKRAEVQMWENLSWGESLMQQAQYGAAFKMLRRECLAHPFSFHPWRVLMRNALPVSLVNAVVRLKNGQPSTSS